MKLVSVVLHQFCVELHFGIWYREQQAVLGDVIAIRKEVAVQLFLFYAKGGHHRDGIAGAQQVRPAFVFKCELYPALVEDNGPERCLVCFGGGGYARAESATGFLAGKPKNLTEPSRS